MNRLGGDDITGPGAVPQSGANPGVWKRPSSRAPTWGLHLSVMQWAGTGHKKGGSPITGVPPFTHKWLIKPYFLGAMITTRLNEGSSKNMLPTPPFHDTSRRSAEIPNSLTRYSLTD